MSTTLRRWFTPSDRKLFGVLWTGTVEKARFHWGASVRKTRRLWVVLLVSSAVACGGGGGADSTVAPPATPVATTITVALPVSAIEVGSSTTAAATVLDQNNSVLSGSTIAWSSENTSVATVSSAGVVSAVAAGTTNIVASVGLKQGKVPVTVTTWVFDGTLLSNSDFGGAAGALADCSVIQLNDGRFRMFIGGFPNSPGGVGSAISTDGLKFTMEAGVRLPTPLLIGGVSSSFIKPVAIRMDAGRIRLFASANGGAPDGIYSFTSTDDGITFTPDAGVRITLAASGLGQVGVGSLVKVKGGGWRMYLNDNPPGTTVGTAIVLGHPKTVSAFSTDLTTWTMDPGVRIGTGATLSGDAQSAGAVLNADGSTTILYFRASNATSYQSTSADGLSFTTEAFTGFAATGGRFPVPAVDAYMFPLPDGSIRM